MDVDQLIASSQRFVNELFRDKLPTHLYFHNAVHTEHVVLASQEIGQQTGLDLEQMAVVTLAAWFHDTGYTQVYKGHELVSLEIVTEFLANKGLSAGMVDEIRCCIMATRFPQQPTNMMEQVLCDADFYHLSVDHYDHFARVLKMEWQEELGLDYTPQQWDMVNLEALSSHSYFTFYGKTVLQLKKQHNISRLEQRIS